MKEKKTKGRMKMKVGKKIIYSDTFKCSINPAMFARQTGNVGGILYWGGAEYFEEKQ